MQQDLKRQSNQTTAIDEIKKTTKHPRPKRQYLKPLIPFLMLQYFKFYFFIKQTFKQIKPTNLYLYLKKYPSIEIGA